MHELLDNELLLLLREVTRLKEELDKRRPLDSTAVESLRKDLSLRLFWHMKRKLWRDMSICARDQKEHLLIQWIRVNLSCSRNKIILLFSGYCCNLY